MAAQDQLRLQYQELAKQFNWSTFKKKASAPTTRANEPCKNPINSNRTNSSYHDDIDNDYDSEATVSEPETEQRIEHSNLKAVVPTLNTKTVSPSLSPSPRPPESSKHSSTSSVLSKHNFNLLDISSSSSSSTSRSMEQKRQNTQQQPQISALSLYSSSSSSSSSASSAEHHRRVFQPTTEHGNRNSNNTSYLLTPQPQFSYPTQFTTVTQPLTAIRKSQPSPTKAHHFSDAFLDLCSSESESEERVVNNHQVSANVSVFKTPYVSSAVVIQTPDIRTIHKPKTKKPLQLISNTVRPKARLTSPFSNSKKLCSLTLTAKQFKKGRDEYTLQFFHSLNDRAFDGALVLQQNVTYSWCKTLNKTAGDCRLFSQTKDRKAHIRLATKVLDDVQKLKQTLCHEICHALAWIVDASKAPPHGARFRYWADKAEMTFTDISVSTCHNYKIQYKFQWRCTQCTYVYGRHSKSINVDTHRCGVCKGKLCFLGRLKADGSLVVPTKRAPTAFQTFMKQNMAAIKKKNPAATHAQVMKILSEKYKASKQA